jgi:hypothetical protein
MKKNQLHSNRKLFYNLIAEIEQETGINPVFLEKDYWINETLYFLKNSEHGEHIIFKGGTALAKAHKITNRFSEDLDVSIDFESWKKDSETDSYTSIKKVISSISKTMPDFLPVDTLAEENSSPKGHIRKVPLNYSPVFQSQVIKSYLLLEITASRHPTENSLMPVTSFIHDYLYQSSRNDLIEQYHLQPVIIKVGSYERTFCDKIFRMNKLGYYDYPLEKIGDKVRDIYDLHKGLTHPKSKEFFASGRFIEVLKEVEKEELYEKTGKDVYSMWARKPVSESILFKHPEMIYELKKGFERNISGLLFEKLPGIDDIYESLKNLSKHVQRYDKEKGILTVDKSKRLEEIARHKTGRTIKIRVQNNKRPKL